MSVVIAGDTVLGHRGQSRPDSVMWPARNGDES
jgi:hypothetical protein